MLVSHDMRLISQVAREIYEVEDQVRPLRATQLRVWVLLVLTPCSPSPNPSCVCQTIKRFKGDIMAYKNKLRKTMEEAAARAEASGWTVKAGDAGTRTADAPAAAGAGGGKSAAAADAKKKKKKKPTTSGLVVANVGAGGAQQAVRSVAPPTAPATASAPAPAPAAAPTPPSAVSQRTSGWLKRSSGGNADAASSWR